MKYPRVAGAGKDICPLRVAGAGAGMVFCSRARACGTGIRAVKRIQEAAAMDREEVGRRGIPSLLKPSSSSIDGSPKIWKDTAGKVDIFVAGSGTGGTVSGVGKYLKMQNPGIKIICVEPAESPVISGPGFLPEVLDTSIINETVTMITEEAMANARRLAKEEGLLVGNSSGANLAACLKGKMVVTVFPSGGERYMNSDLFADVREECIAMTF
ncbi:hypothetical protein U9M48_036733 [Paspalum notatum var. saurae]|uniref:Tryptophan synthase beta chain-like PALP domain-containing protein n=1 Tax=Paspalum notatum var. saurae TaxID=547442 RepID=A0AAQ3XAD6_PASNO